MTDKLRNGNQTIERDLLIQRTINQKIVLAYKNWTIFSQKN